jgi:hypothetical protein
LSGKAPKQNEKNFEGEKCKTTFKFLLVSWARHLEIIMFKSYWFKQTSIEKDYILWHQITQITRKQQASLLNVLMAGCDWNTKYLKWVNSRN